MDHWARISLPNACSWSDARTGASILDQPQLSHRHHRLHNPNVPTRAVHADVVPQDPFQLVRLLPRHVLCSDPRGMLSVVQVEVGRFDLLRRYPLREPVELVQQRGDFPCLGADVDVVKTEAEEGVWGQVHAGFVDQRFCHDWSRWVWAWILQFRVV